MEKAFLVTHKTKIDPQLHTDIDMYYFGDAECEFNFVSLLNNKELLQQLIDSKKKVTLLTPHITQKLLEYFEVFVEKHEDLFGSMITEIVVNDIGMLYLVKKSKILKPLKRIYGNYLFGQFREPLTKIKSSEVDTFTSIDSPMYVDFLKNNLIQGIELFNVFQWFNIRFLDVNIHMYYPYVVHTMWRYCQRSLLAIKEDNLRVVSACSGCKWKEEYSFFHVMNNGEMNHKRGNKTFHMNFSLAQTSKIERIIYNYDFIKS